MDSKIKIFILLLGIPLFSMAQNKAFKKYVDSSELQLKLFAAEVFYGEQAYLADSNSIKCNVDYFVTKYFEECNYSQVAFEKILNYSKQEAHKDFVSEEIGKCLCYNSSLLFFGSDKLNKKIKEMRKYLNRATPALRSNMLR